MSVSTVTSHFHSRMAQKRWDRAQKLWDRAQKRRDLTTAMATRSIAGDADGREVSGLLWRATGGVEGTSRPGGLTRAEEHTLWRLGTPALLRGLWGGAQALMAGDGGRGCTSGRARTCMGRWWRGGGGCATDRDGHCPWCRGAPTSPPAAGTAAFSIIRCMRGDEG